METILVVALVVVAIVWGCWSSYKVLAGKAGCACSSDSCNSKDSCAKS